MQRVLTRTNTQEWGFTISRQNTFTVVSSVTHLGIAHLADLNVGDSINSINNLVCARVPLSALVENMSGSYQLIITLNRPQGTTGIATPSAAAGATVIEINSDDDDEQDDDDEDDSDGEYYRSRREYGYHDDRNLFDDSDDEDSVESARRRQLANRLLHQAAAHAAHARSNPPVRPPAPARPPVAYTRGEVVDLISDDDEPPRRASSTAPAAAPHAAPSRAQTAPPAATVRTQTAPLATAARPQPPQVGAHSGSSNASTTGMAVQSKTPAGPASAATASVTASTGKRSLAADMDASESASAFKRRKVKCGNVEIKLEFEPKLFGEANVGDEVVEVLGEDDAAPAAAVGVDGVEVVVPAAAQASAAADDDDFEGDFQIIGNTMQVASDMPHQRYSCTMHPFRMEPANNSYGRSAETAAMLADRVRVNSKHCANCYCYVCDSKVTECVEWLDHCHATHKEPKWKLEKDARSSKLLRLMTAARKAAFFLRYKDALAANRATGYQAFGTFCDADDDEAAFLEADYNSRLQSSAINGLNPPVRGKVGVAKDLTRTVDLMTLVRLKLHSSRRIAASSSAEATALSLDKYLEASELLLRALVNPRHAGENPQPLAAAFVSWLLHPMCASDVRGVMRSEFEAAAQRSMIFGHPIYASLRDLAKLDEATLARLRGPQLNISAAAAVVPLPAALLNCPEAIHTTLIAELLDFGSFGVIKQLAQSRPNLAHSLIVMYMRNGSLMSCLEAVSLASQMNQQRPFSSLRVAIQEIPLDKLLRFISTAISYNTTLSKQKNSAQTGWSLSGDCTDVVFNILFTRVFRGATCFSQRDFDAVAVYMNKSATTHRLEKVSEWIESEIGDVNNHTALVSFIYVSYSNWRALQSTIAAGGIVNINSISTTIITPAAFGSLFAPVLILLANCFGRHFVPPPSTDSSSIGVGLNTLLACHIAQRAIPLLSSSTGHLSSLDVAIRNTWIVLPELRKAKHGEVCANSACPRRSSIGSSATPNILELDFCAVPPRPTDRAHHSAPSAALTVMVSSSPRVVATYCDVHYTYDTFLMCLVAPKSTAESNTALACWNHSVSLTDALYLLQQFPVTSSGTEDDSQHTSSAFIAFLVEQREPLLMIWKCVVRYLYSYMHALFFMENSGLTNLMQKFSQVLKPWMAEVDVITANQLAAHPACQGSLPELLVELQALDLNIRMMYHFSNLLVKSQESIHSSLSVVELRAFKAAVVRLESVGGQTALAAKLCQMYLLEYPTVSTRAVWHSFWRRFLQSLVSKRNTSTVSEAAQVETQAVLLLLEDWGPLKELVAKAPGTPKNVSHFILGLTLLLKSDFNTMNYGAVSGSNVLKNTLEPIACVKFTVPLSTEQQHPIALISEKCIEFPDSGLAHLVQQFSVGLLQYGALDFQPFFAYVLKKRADASAVSQHTPPLETSVLETALEPVYTAFTDCVALVSSPGRNPGVSYPKVLCGCIGLQRFDLVEKLVQAGFASVLQPITPAAPQFHVAKAQLLSSALMMAGNGRDFERLLSTMDSFVMEVYVDATSVTRMAPVIRRFCPSSGEGFTMSSAKSAEAGESLPVKLLKFYHHYDTNTFFDYWNSVPIAEKEAAKAKVLKWTKLLAATPRFRTDVHISMASQMMDRDAFAAYLSSSELDGPGFDKYQIMQALVKIVQMDMAAAPLLVPAIVKSLFALTTVTASMRATLLSICTVSALPLPPSDEGNTEYTDARTLLLYLGAPDAYAEALAAIYADHYTVAQKEALGPILLDKSNPEAFVKLLLRAKDYPQLFSTLRDVYYGANRSGTTSTEVAASVIEAVAGALVKLRVSLTLVNLYNPALVGAGAGNAGLNVFQKEFFDDRSFVVGLARFLLFLQSQHIDDKLVAYPAPLGDAINALIEHVKHLAHGDVVIGSYLRLHLKFTASQATAFGTDCSNCNYFTMPYVPAASGNASSPKTFCYDTFQRIAQAPKFYTLALSMITHINALVALHPMIGGDAGRTIPGLLETVLTSPCTYHRDARKSFETVSGGVLWIPRLDSSGALGLCSSELCRVLQSYGPSMSTVLVGPVLRRLGGNLVHPQPMGADRPVVTATEQHALRQWSTAFSEELRRITANLSPVTNYGFIQDLFQLHVSFQVTTLLNNVEQGLRRPDAELYRKIVFNLAANALLSGTSLKPVLLALTQEFHHPDNSFRTFFTDQELDLLVDYIGSSEETKQNVRLALMCVNKMPSLPAKALLKIPRIIRFLSRESYATSYDSFAPLYHAIYYTPVWIQVAEAGTEHSETVFAQAEDCFRAIVEACRQNTVAARVRAQIEEAMQGFATLFELFPDKLVQRRALMQGAKQALKSKQAVLKAMAAVH